MKKTKMHSFRSKPMMYKGVWGHFWEQKHGEIKRGFVSEAAKPSGLREVIMDISEIPEGVEMIDDNIYWEDTYTAKVLNGTYYE